MGLKAHYTVRITGKEPVQVLAHGPDLAVVEAVKVIFPGSTVQELFEKEDATFRGRRVDENGKTWNFQIMNINRGRTC